MKNLLSFLSKEVLNLAVGYLAGLIASSMVSRFFVKKGLANLWGLTAFKREAIKKGDWEWLMFGASYAVGLAVMIAVHYGMRRLRGQQTVHEE